MVVQDSLRTDLVSSPLKNDKKHRLKQRFDVQRKLGQGTYGKVQLAVNRESGQEVAIKTIKKNKIGNEQDLVRIRREIQIMSSIQHPHITHIYEVFENKDKIVLVMQFASGGELYDYLSEKKVLSDLEARRLFRQIAAAVYYCHKNKICHRDLKLENILLDERGNAKIADFGLSNVFDEKNLLNTSCGSPLYASPEIVNGFPYYGPEVDCWSMGVLLYTLVYGAMPFDGSNFKKLVQQISEGDYFEPKNKSNASELIRRLLTVSASKRATIVDICMDCWVNLGYEHSLLQVAEDMANLTPVRLDLLLALAPSSPAEDHPREEDEPMDDVAKALAKNDEEEEEEEEEEMDNTDTAANSFAFMKGSRASQLSVSSPNLQKAVDDYEEDSENEFLPADIAALQAEFGLEDSMPRIASLARMGQMSPATSPTDNARKTSPTANINENSKHQEISPQNKGTEIKTTPKVSPSSTKILKTDAVEDIVNPKEFARKNSAVGAKISESFVSQRKESLTNHDDIAESKRFVRPPGKIIIPKTFDSPQTTPSPKASIAPKKLTKTDSKLTPEESEPTERFTSTTEATKEKIPTEDINKNLIEPQITSKADDITEEKKNIAKGILKKGIAKAKLAERKMSKQGSVDSDASSSCSTPISSAADAKPSFFKAPKPYAKEEEISLQSQAEIKLASVQTSAATPKSEPPDASRAPLWDNKLLDDRVGKPREWRTQSPDSMIGNWREQMEESLRRLSPEDERSSNPSYALSKIEDDKPLVPIARSYKKFTFTKDGACITETKKIYATPGADGSWTKVEKKTKITTRPGNAEEFERFRDLHMRSDTPSVARSDSQSSSGSNDVYDDIFDSWTGDTMMCNMRKMNNMFQKFSRDPFLRRERRRNPFRFFRRTDSERSDRESRPYEGRRSSDRESSENDEEYDVHFDDSNAVVYGSQGLWQLLRSANRGFPGRVTIQHEPISYGRSASQDRTDSRFDADWKRTGSRASSGYNTGTRSQSRDRTESPREKVLRFVLESPRESFSREASLRSPSRNEKWSMKRNLSRHNPRRDSGVGSDGYESEYSIRHSPSDEMSRTGRVSSISSICNDKQNMIKNFMRSLSKDYTSPPVSPSSMGGGAREQLSESRKNLVEEWLDMSAEKGPFGMGGGRRSVTSQGSGAPSYATMRPREYLHYNRSSSDKLAECGSFFSSFDDPPRRRPQSAQRENPQLRVRASTYSPVSEESLRDAPSTYHSDGSQSGSSVHRINFTISDGRSSTSPQNTTRYVRQFSTNEGCITMESPPPRVETQSSRSTSQPVVQMRVSINRGSPAISTLPGQSSSKGLWDQQISTQSLRQDCSVNRSPSPVPGIRQFSTEIQHCVGTPETVPLMSVECNMSDKQTVQTGKTSPYKRFLPIEASIWDMATACPPPCMDSAPELININQHDLEFSSRRSPASQSDRPKHLSSFQAGAVATPYLNSNGANTPDSLEDSAPDQPVVLMATKLMTHFPMDSSDPSPEESETLNVDVQPLGVLWNSPKSAVEVKEANNFVACVQTRHSAPSSVNSELGQGDDLQRRCLENTTSEFGSIWNQKSACHPFDLLKNLLSDDSLGTFSSSKCVLGSSRPETNRNELSDVRMDNGNGVVDSSLSVIDNLELECLAQSEKFHKMPSLMDDLQSPKEVLRQAMKICDSLEKCK